MAEVGRSPWRSPDEGRHRRAAAALLVAAMALGGCVDHAEQSSQFCGAIVPMLDPATDAEALSEDLAVERADAVAEEMRHAEDGRRPVREAARDLLDAYDEIAVLLGDDEATPEEIAETAEELQTARGATREACGSAQAQSEG